MIKLTDFLGMMSDKKLLDTRVVIKNASETIYDGPAGECPLKVFHKAVVHEFKYNLSAQLYFIDVLYES